MSAHVIFIGDGDSLDGSFVGFRRGWLGYDSVGVGVFVGDCMGIV